MKFYVLIATYNRTELLRRTLQSLSEARRPSGFERVIVVENGMQAGAEQACAEVSGKLPVEYSFLPHPGKGRALQHWLEILGEGFVLFLDDDVRVSPEVFEVYAQAAQEHGKDAFYGGRIFVDYEEKPQDWLIRYLPSSAKGWEQSSSSWPWFLGANYGAFVERILAVGGFDSRLGPGSLKPGTANNPIGVETELQRRLAAAGCQQIYLPQAQVWHYVPKASCTPAWALHRVYRAYFTRMLTQEEPDPGVVWLGAPRWMWRHLASASLRALTAGFSRDPSRRFELKREYYKYRGLVRGAQMRNKDGKALKE